MTELITIKQVQELLKVDRITVYRMLKDGRLDGFKVGKQWRIPQSEIDRLLRGETAAVPETRKQLLTPEEALPVHCIQVIQDIFADMLGISSVTIDLEGNRITEFSSTCEFCQIIQQSEAGREACEQTWKNIGASSNGKFRSSRCHAGLNYTSCKIEQFGQPLAIQIGGQFVASEDEKKSISGSLPEIAERLQVDESKLEEALASIPIIEDSLTPQITDWLEKVAGTFEVIAYERSELLGRLNEIASISTFQNKGEFLNQ